MEIDICFLQENERVQCEHKIITGEYTNTGRFCSNEAHYNVEGEKLCKYHAGEWCLNYCMHEAKEN